MRKLIGIILLCMPLATFGETPRIQNVTCSTCSITIRKALERVPGVIDAKVDYDHKTATVKYYPDKADESALVKATTNAGFPAKLHTGEAK